MTHTLTFTEQELMLLDKALGALPYREVVSMIASINRQIAAANAPKPEPEQAPT